jgi:hypothetical protein
MLALTGQVALAQNSVQKVLTGGVKVEVIQRCSGPQTLPKPEKILICDFTMPAEVITLDKSTTAQLHRHSLLLKGRDDDSTPEALRQEVQESFSEALTSELSKTTIHAERMSGNGAILDAGQSDPRLVVEGEFTAINEGNESKRIMIGFGRGGSDVRAHVTASLLTQNQRSVLLEFELKSDSGKKPGALATMGVGSLAVGAAAGDVGDRRSSVKGDASRMAKAVAKQIEEFMTSDEWPVLTSANERAK